LPSGTARRAHIADAYDQDMTNTQQIIESIDDRLRKLNGEIETLTAARSALDAGHAPPAKRRSTATESANGTGSPRPVRRARRPKSDRPVEVVPAGRLELLLSETGGLTTSALAEQANGDRDQVLILLRELEAAGRIRRTGQRRSTRWHAITDEDRIRERAAELAARRKPTA
jgi:hypothetical protein